MDEQAASVDIPPAAASRGLWIWVSRILVLLLMATLAVLAWQTGLSVRHWTWDTTRPIRLASGGSDTGIDHDYQWARRAAVEGTANQYDKMHFEQPKDRDWLDDPPLRLAIFSAWGKWSLEHFPKVEKWTVKEPYGLSAPLLRFNLFMEAVGLVSAFFLTRLWVVRGFASGRSESVLDTGSDGWMFRTCMRGVLAVLVVFLNPLTLRHANIWLQWDAWLIPVLLLAISALIDQPLHRTAFRGCMAGLIAALLLWFNPAVILSGYGWPTWDLWLIPMFLLACLMASLNWWFTAGIVVGIGAMLNGQQALAIPLLMIWSIILLKPLGTLRFAGGVVLAVALITLPSLLTFIPAEQLHTARAAQAASGEPAQVALGIFKIQREVDVPAILWTAGILLGSAGLPWVGWLTLMPPIVTENAGVSWWRRMLASPWAWRGFAVVGVVALVYWPWLLKRNRADWLTGLVATAGLAAGVLTIRPRGIFYLSACATGTALLLCMSVFHGSSAWYDCGFDFGMNHWPRLEVGLTDNLPAIMVHGFHWAETDFKIIAVSFTIERHLLWIFPGHQIDVAVPLGLFLRRLCGCTIALCCLGAGIHARRRSPRVLIALSAIWLMFFCFPPQIDQRYLLFAAGISCICAGAGGGMTLLGMLLWVVSLVMTATTLLLHASTADRDLLVVRLARQFPHLFSSKPTAPSHLPAGQRLFYNLAVTHPDLGYAVILITLIFLYYSVAFNRKDKLTAIAIDPVVPVAAKNRSGGSSANPITPAAISPTIPQESPPVQPLAQPLPTLE